MVDSSGANYAGVRITFGLEYMIDKLISCQWHFMHNMEILAQSITEEEDKDDFLELCPETSFVYNNFRVSTGSWESRTTC